MDKQERYKEGGEVVVEAVKHGYLFHDITHLVLTVLTCHPAFLTSTVPPKSEGYSRDACCCFIGVPSGLLPEPLLCISSQG